MLDGIQHASTEEQVLDRALREFNEDGVFSTDTFIALREEGIDPDFYLAQLEGSNGLNVYEGDPIE